MKTFKTLNEMYVVVNHASAVTSGYGHKKITVELMEEFSGKTETFSATTINMPGFDDANDFEGQEKYDALYDLIESKIEEEVYEWLEI